MSAERGLALPLKRQSVPAISRLLIAWGGTALLVSPLLQSTMASR